MVVGEPVKTLILITGETCKTLYYGLWVRHVKPIMMVRGQPRQTL